MHTNASIKARGEIYNQVCEKGYDAKSGAFTQSYGFKRAGCERSSDPARRLPSRRATPVISTVKAIGERLRDGPLVRRYDTDRT